MSAQPSARKGLRVVKVGGSLLDWEQLPIALSRWLDAQPPACNVLIAGGGALADVIRQADSIHALGQQKSHELCVELLGATARLLEALLAGRALKAAITDWHELKGSNRLPTYCVLDTRNFLLNIEAAAPHRSLPQSWDVTSDSIAALVACSLAADELVLLKSCDRPGESSLEALAAEGYVDRYFPTAVVPFIGAVRMVNLRGISRC